MYPEQEDKMQPKDKEAQMLREEYHTFKNEAADLIKARQERTSQDSKFWYAMIDALG